MRKASSRSLIGILVVVLVSGLVAGIILDRTLLNSFVPPDNIPKGAATNFRLMAEAWNTITEFYVDQRSLTNNKLAYGAISGMVDALGDKGHSRFMTPDVVNQMKGVVRGQFVGVGIELQTRGNQMTVVAPLDNSPAQEAGVRPGDVILRVDDTDVTGLTLEQAVGLVRGTAGTNVRLDIKTPSTGATKIFTLKRRNLPIHNVNWHLLPGTAIVHVRISAFTRGVGEDLKGALKQLLDKRGEGLQGLVLDLRNNPGGLLEEAVAVTSQFVSEGPVVQVRGPDNETKQLTVEPGAIARAVPLVVMINAGTASAAEIVAGALQDRNRATLVGDRTVGAGTVLNQYPLDDGSAILLATYEWLTPAGRSIRHKGIDPNIALSLPPEGKILSPRAERDMTAAELRATQDTQLLAAIELLADKKPK